MVVYFTPILHIHVPYNSSLAFKQRKCERIKQAKDASLVPDFQKIVGEYLGLILNDVLLYFGFYLVSNN